MRTSRIAFMTAAVAASFVIEAGVAAQTEKPSGQHATGNLPLIGGWLAGKLFGTAQNAAPDGTEGPRAGPRPAAPEPDWREQSP